MMIRLGFVSNSSSSSFIISTNKTDESVKVEIDLVDFIETLGEYGESGLTKIVKTKQELDEYYVDVYGWSECNTLEKIFNDEEWIRIEYEKSLKEIESGKVVIFGEIDYSKSDMMNFLKKCKNINFISEGD